MLVCSLPSVTGQTHSGFYNVTESAGHMSVVQHNTFTHLQAPDEVIEMPGHCMACNGEATTRVFQTSIPYFKVHFFKLVVKPAGNCLFTHCLAP